MLKSARLGKEISVRVVNKIGVLSDISRIMADHGLNIIAVAGYGVDNTDQAEITVVTDDNLRASEALKAQNYGSVVEKEVVILELENKPGALKNITKKLAEKGIDMKFIYGTACSASCPATIILSTSDNEKALVAFKQ